MTDDLSPTLGGGPAEWPHKRIPPHTFIAPWKLDEMMAESDAQIARLRATLESARESEQEWLRQRTDDLLMANFPDRPAIPLPTSGNSMRALRRWMGN